MRTQALIAAVIVFALANPPKRAHAADAPNPAGATPIAGHAVFDAFHGKAGIDRIVADLTDRYTQDPRIADIFRAADIPHLRAMLSDQICYLLGGGCAYDGKDMKTAHKDMGLQDADLNALVEDLQSAMDDEHVPYAAQNKLLAKLAPLRRVVVER